MRRNLGSLLLAALAVAAAVACYCTSSTAAVRDSCKAIGGRAKPPRQRNVHSILTQNCLGMKSATRKTELISVLRQREPLAVCLQETWRTGVEELSEDGWLFIGSAPASQQGRGSMGVGIMLSPLGVTALDERHTDLGPRVVAVRLLVNETGGPRPRRQLGLFTISGYAPVSTASDAEWDAYYDTLGCAISRARPGDTVIIGTDANASIGRGRLDGSRGDTRAGGVGPHGLAHINESGRRMRSFLETHALASLASFFRKKHYGTWQHPRSKMMHQLDHILVSRDELKRFRDAGSLPGQLLGSDHRPVGCKLRVAIRLQRKRAVRERSKLSRLDFSSLSEDRLAVAFAHDVHVVERAWANR